MTDVLTVRGELDGRSEMSPLTQGLHNVGLIMQVVLDPSGSLVRLLHWSECSPVLNTFARIEPPHHHVFRSGVPKGMALE